MRHPFCILRVLFALSLLCTQLSSSQLSLMTLYPDSITQTGAILRARINPDGHTGEIKFHWGVDPTQHEVSAGVFSGASLIHIRTYVEGMTPNTLYTYRVSWTGVNPQMAGIALFRTFSDSTNVGYVTYLNIFDGGVSNELAFGLHMTATRCLDVSLGELWLPPRGPQGMPDFRFIDPRGFNNQCMDQGLMVDLRRYNHSAQIDTYKIQFDPGALGYPVLISWSDVASRYSGDVRMKTPTGTFFNVDMKAQNSALIDEPLTNLLIVASGPMNPSIVLSAGENEGTPNTFQLGQNYPNPFNPMTNIKFKIPRTSFVTLKVFDVLGREVATLLNEEKQPGEYSLTWDATGMASGLYLYRLAAGGFSMTQKAMLMR